MPLRRHRPPRFAGPLGRRAVLFRRGGFSPRWHLRRVLFALEYGSAKTDQMVTWEASSPSGPLGEDDGLGEAKSQVTISSWEHLFAECGTPLRRVPHSAKGSSPSAPLGEMVKKFQNFSVFAENPAFKQNIHTVYQFHHNMHIYIVYHSQYTNISNKHIYHKHIYNTSPKTCVSPT